MEYYLVFMVFLPVLHTVYMVVYLFFLTNCLFMKSFTFTFVFGSRFWQSKTLVEGNGVMVAD